MNLKLHCTRAGMVSRRAGVFLTLWASSSIYGLCFSLATPCESSNSSRVPWHTQHFFKQPYRMYPVLLVSVFLIDYHAFLSRPPFRCPAHKTCGTLLTPGHCEKFAKNLQVHLATACFCLHQVLRFDARNKKSTIVWSQWQA